MIAIAPEYLSLAKFVSGRLFTIPGYQRAYSWTSKERADLFEDIRRTHAKGQDAGHFMAAAVCLRREKVALGTDEYHKMEVVDGQQRLTTLIVLLKAITLTADRNLKAERKVADDLDEILVKEDGGALLLLQTNHDTSHYFEDYLRNGKSHPPESAKTLADRELLTAIAECRQFVGDWQGTGRTLPELTALLKNRLFFLVHEINDEAAVYTVFEVLNSRGLEVSWLDRLKSVLMGNAFELSIADKVALVKNLHTTWTEVYRTIGLRQGMSTEALRFAATLRSKDLPNRPLSEEASVEALRAKATTAKTIAETAQWLRRVTAACDLVAGDVRQNSVTRIAQARLLATAIHLREDLKEADVKSLLGLWERVTFRIYGMLGNDARVRVGDYVRLAWRVVNEKLDANAIRDAIKQIGANFPIKDAVESLRKENCYEGWEHELRYFLFRYEEHLSKQAGVKLSADQWAKIWLVSPSKSIEHIWAQSKAPQSVCHQLGNLVLLTPNLNSKLQDKPVKDKVQTYRKTGLLIANEVADRFAKKKTWTAADVNAREAELLKWAMQEWAD